MPDVIRLVVGFEMAVFVPVAVLCFEVLTAATQRQKGSAKPDDRGRRPKLAILIPAHNEASIIAATLATIRTQLVAGDRLLVVADNCSDDTVAVAKTGGAEIASRTDPARRGKGYALEFGIRRLADDPPEIVIIIDADCQPAPNCIDRLASACVQSGRPIQGRYLMHAKAQAAPRMKIAEFAWLVKNRVRPMGLHRFGFPTHLTGSGMAFPWIVIRDAHLASGHIVEDLKLGIDLACVGSSALYCDAAMVDSDFPMTAKDSRTQRTRWEHGHLHVILTEAPRMLWIALRKLDGGLLALALDLSVPPLALLVIAIFIEWSVSLALLLLAAQFVPFKIASATLGALLLAVLSAWLRFGRQVVSVAELAGGFAYVLMKIPVYLRFLVSRQVTWVRAKREKE